ncbi:MAG: hypothetical protein A2603_09725 [Bdellovibrionales bacterium RIFOXYD1_FULL_55_31]|nr:MAG: hypothetical protein A2603_09725 [Bdellovibrionales bacterium RIFOXYD1_FULL_55_31]
MKNLSKALIVVGVICQFAAMSASGEEKLGEAQAAACTAVDANSNYKKQQPAPATATATTKTTKADAAK